MQHVMSREIFVGKLHQVIEQSTQKGADENTVLDFILSSAGLQIRATRMIANTSRAYTHAMTMGWEAISGMQDPQFQIGVIVDELIKQCKLNSRA